MHRPVLDAVVEFMDRTMPERAGEIVVIPDVEEVPAR
jgi:hypothetical protein